MYTCFWLINTNAPTRNVLGRWEIAGCRSHIVYTRTYIYICVYIYVLIHVWSRLMLPFAIFRGGERLLGVVTAVARFWGRRKRKLIVVARRCDGNMAPSMHTWLRRDVFYTCSLQSDYIGYCIWEGVRYVWKRAHLCGNNLVTQGQ